LVDTIDRMRNASRVGRDLETKRNCGRGDVVAEAGGVTAWRRRLSASGWRRTRIIVLAAGLVLVVGWLTLPAFITSQETRDARDVFCLQRGERPALASAAVALGFADPDSTQNGIVAGDYRASLWDWRDDRRADFDRACDALAAVRGKSDIAAGAGASTGAAAVVLPLLTVVLTWALSNVSTRRQTRVTRGQADAGELRVAVTTYNSAANQFLDSLVTFPADKPSTEMDAARDTLVGRLNGVVEREPDWLAAREAVALLRDGELGTSMDPTLRGMRETAARGRKITELRTKVRDVSDIGFLVADALAEHGGVDRRLTRPLAEGSGS
jgi:hypothetical protein